MNTGIYKGGSDRQLWWVSFHPGEIELMDQVCQWGESAIGNYSLDWWLYDRVIYFCEEQHWLLFRMTWL